MLYIVFLQVDGMCYRIRVLWYAFSDDVISECGQPPDPLDSHEACAKLARDVVLKLRDGLFADDDIVLNMP